MLQRQQFAFFDPGKHAALSAHKMIAAIALPHRVDHHDLHIGASIGISIYPQDGPDAEALIKHADTAMFRAKDDGPATRTMPPSSVP